MGLFGTLVGGIKGAVSGFAHGGPLGAVTGAVRGITHSNQPPVYNALPPVPLPRGLSSLLPQGRQGPDVPRNFPGAVPEPGMGGAIQRFLPGGQSGYTGAPPGYHVNKAYMDYLRANAAGKHHQNPFDERRAVNTIVRNRKMNPLNPRALARANRRQVAAVRMMRRTLKGSGYTITRSHFGAKKTRRR